MTDFQLLDEHVADFNDGVRTGDFRPMLARFTDDAELAFEGVPAGPYVGIDAIEAAYRDSPPDDQITVLDAQLDGDTMVAPYSWARDEGRRSGEMRLTVRGGRIARLVVTFD
jgi:SnoaL-like protein